ncbi:MAG: strictosidine synthase family protein [Desulfobacterales bacterium]|nr:strictosidine synthase family protein [Desulfobacterales bacterium]
MLKRILWLATCIVLVLAIYLLFWPTPLEPAAWSAPPNPGCSGPFAANERLKAIRILSIGDNHGPEDVAIDARGRIYVSTHEGRIVRLQADGSNPENWVETGGRPLGVDFDQNGALIVADAFRGLLSISENGAITELATIVDGVPLRYADDVDVAVDGKIYFSDASTKFGAREFGGTYEASLLDLVEHGGHGRLMVFDPASGRAKTLLDGLNFANGVAVSHDQTHVLVNETGSYRVIRYWLTGPKRGEAEPLIEALPSFPDNISTGRDGRFWIGLASPRNALVDALSDKPFLREVTMRLPRFLRPRAEHYGHIIAIDKDGKVLMDLQDPDGAHPVNTGVYETEEFLYISSLVAPALARLPNPYARPPGP